MRAYLLALSFLTGLPIKVKEASAGEMEQSLAAYPLVGLTLGVIAAAVAWLAHWFNLSLAGDTLVIVTLLFLTRGLHLDGVMDTADGLFCQKDQQGKLEVMKDSRVGAMGVSAALVVILLKITLLFELNYPAKLSWLLLMPAAGRWLMVYGVSFFPYARASGLGGAFSRQSKIPFLLATVLLGLFTLLAGGWPGIIVAAASFALAAVVAKSIASALGGLTGDVYGALGEIAETGFLLAAVILQAGGAA